MEIILGRAIPNKFEVEFSENLSPEQASTKWGDILDIVLALSQQLDDCFVRNRVANEKLKQFNIAIFGHSVIFGGFLWSNF